MKSIRNKRGSRRSAGHTNGQVSPAGAPALAVARPRIFLPMLPLQPVWSFALSTLRSRLLPYLSLQDPWPAEPLIWQFFFCHIRLGRH